MKENTLNIKKIKDSLLLFFFHNPIVKIIKQHESPTEALCGFFAVIDTELKSDCISVKCSVQPPILTSPIKLSGHGAEQRLAVTNCLSVINHRPCPGRLRPSA